LRLDLTEKPRLLKDDCPGEQGQDKQDAEYDACDPARLFKQSERAGKNDQRQTRNDIPQEKKYKSLPNNRSTRIQEGQTIHPMRGLDKAHEDEAEMQLMQRNSAARARVVSYQSKRKQKHAGAADRKNPIGIDIGECGCLRLESGVDSG